MNTEALACAVYRSPKKEGMYLYVLRQENPFAELPAPLLQHFGAPGHVLDLDLTPERKLARVQVTDVIQALRTQGFYLQMPPGEGNPDI
ncbi:MAG TPA: YcgL domain-containing protein [Dongiaceae bacterium]|nr:YcgL domain-containing protein [Dongiaceae bacterium]